MTPDLARYILARLDCEARTILTGGHLVELVNRALTRKVWLGMADGTPLVARTGCASLPELRRAIRSLTEIGLVTANDWVPLRVPSRGVFELTVELDWRRWAWSSPRTLDLPTTIEVRQRGMDAITSDVTSYLVERLVRHHAAHDIPFPHAHAEDWSAALSGLSTSLDTAKATITWALDTDPWTTHLLKQDAADILVRNWTYLSNRAIIAQLSERA